MHLILLPFKWFVMFFYAIMVQFVRPSWCADKIVTLEKNNEMRQDPRYATWNNDYCNN
jgi:hypothetical protein